MINSSFNIDYLQDKITSLLDNTDVACSASGYEQEWLKMNSSKSKTTRPWLTK